MAGGEHMWFIFALLSAVFAALTSILAKVGINGVNSNLATAIRTVVVVIMAWGMVFLTNAQNGLSGISRKSWLFLILSGLATGASWLCYYKALQIDLSEEPNWDWFILLVAKTGMRFSEALAITPSDFDFARQALSISKTWDYKGEGGFLPTKNRSSVRKIQIDWQIVVKFSELIKGLPEDEPIFIGKSKIYNSTVNDVLTRHCKQCGISEISIHGLRHTHASLLLFAGVSIASVARRLGHASMTTTQKTYLHIIQELENKDVDLIMRTLSGL